MRILRVHFKCHYIFFSLLFFPPYSPFLFCFQAFGFSCSLHAKCILNYLAMALKSHSEAERRRRERINGHLAMLRSTDKVVGSSPSLLLGRLFAPFLDQFCAVYLFTIISSFKERKYMIYMHKFMVLQSLKHILERICLFTHYLSIFRLLF